MLKPLRIDIRPLPRGSHASPTRGEKFSRSRVVEASTCPMEAPANCSLNVVPGPENDRRQPVLALGHRAEIVVPQHRD